VSSLSSAYQRSPQAVTEEIPSGPSFESCCVQPFWAMGGGLPQWWSDEVVRVRWTVWRQRITAVPAGGKAGWTRRTVLIKWERIAPIYIKYC